VFLAIYLLGTMLLAQQLQPVVTSWRTLEGPRLLAMPGWSRLELHHQLLPA